MLPPITTTLPLLLLLAAPITVAAGGLNFPFPHDATEQPVPFAADVDPGFVRETALKAGLYRPSIDLVDAADANAGFQEGPSPANMTALAAVWAREYDWFRVQDEINANFSHYALTVAGDPDSGLQGYGHPLPLHFVHERSADEDGAIPLLLLHGWPSTHLEWSKVIGPLTSTSPGGRDGNGTESSNNNNKTAVPSFHVVAPDLPGYGFSPAPTHSGVGSPQLAAAMDRLMKRLGYPRYGVASTDLGWWTALALGNLRPDSVVGHYSDFWFVIPTDADRERLAAGGSTTTTPQERAYIEAFTETNGRYYVHGTAHSYAPLAVANAMTDSPVGFAGWVWHLLNLVSDGFPYSYPDLITQAMMLFIQGSYGNIRLYRPVFFEDQMNTPKSKVPTAAGLWGSPNGPIEAYRNFDKVPDDWLQRVANVTAVYRHDSGGHFPATSRPDEYVEDIRRFFGGLS